MTHELRIPTADPYSYINISFEGTPEEAFAEYQRITALVKGGEGLTDKEFNQVLDKYLWVDGTMLADEYGAMNLDQQSIIQICKRSRKRHESKK